VLRFWNDDVYTNTEGVLRPIVDAMNNRMIREARRSRTPPP
jgi:very-short-patch-repair endonuclease